MIWSTEPPAADPQTSLAGRIADDILAVPGAREAAGEHRVRELAAGVAAYLVTAAPTGAGRDRRRVLHAMSRALWATGYEGLARQVVVLRSGLLHSANWVVAGGGPLWVLDLGPLTLRGEDRTELTLFGVMDRLLDGLADVWDGPAGGGGLGLRRSAVAARRVLGEAAPPRRVAGLAREIRWRCAERLVHLGAVRQWSRVPVVLNLDP